MDGKDIKIRKTAKNSVIIIGCIEMEQIMTGVNVKRMEINNIKDSAEEMEEVIEDANKCDLRNKETVVENHQKKEKQMASTRLVQWETQLVHFMCKECLIR